MEWHCSSPVRAYTARGAPAPSKRRCREHAQRRKPSHSKCVASLFLSLLKSYWCLLYVPWLITIYWFIDAFILTCWLLKPSGRVPIDNLKRKWRKGNETWRKRSQTQGQNESNRKFVNCRLLRHAHIVAFICPVNVPTYKRTQTHT